MLFCILFLSYRWIFEDDRFTFAVAGLGYMALTGWVFRFGGKDFGIYQYINTYKAPRNGKTFFYRYDKTDEIHILAYVKTDLFQEADIGKLNKAFVEFWKQYITTKEEKKEIYFSFVLEVEDDNRVLKSIVRNNSGIMMYKRRYRLGAVYNRYYNRLEILPLYRYSRCKKQYEKMKKDLLDCLGISDVVQA